MRIKNIVPKEIRLKLKLMQRTFLDIKKGNHSNFAKPKFQEHSFKYELALTQEIKKSYLYENKIQNIKMAYGRIEKIVIKPNEIFSFWRIIGAPNKKNGFVKGRNIVKGKLLEDYGGGLCQLSGIIYHLALIAGLRIIERHNHSFDIYTDETRFTPLGADATVVFGYKDLRVLNNYAFPIVFHFEIDENELKIALKSEGLIPEQTIYFQKTKLKSGIEVRSINERNEVVATSCYKNT